MAFSQATITDGPNLAVDNGELSVSWASSSPDGTTFQVYVDRKLAWAGTLRDIVLPLPLRPVRVDVGTVGAGEERVDYSGSLPASPGTGDKVTLSWSGGRFLGADVESFRVYMGTAPGGAVNYATPVATVAAARDGLWVDGYGVGGYGSGGYGYAAIPYTWTSGRLAPGVWNVAVKAVDSAGNESAAATASVTLTARPRPPAADASGKRLSYTYNSSTRVPTLSWQAPPA